MTSPEERAEFDRLADLGAAEMCGTAWNAPKRPVETVQLTGDHLMIIPYRVLVTISRSWKDISLVRQQLAHRLDTALALDRPLLIIHGDYQGEGSDQIADTWGVEMSHSGLPVALERHPAQNHPTQDFGPWPWCGPKLNDHMVSLGADECLAFIGPCDSPRCQRADVHPSHDASGCALAAERAGIDVKRWTV